MQRFTEDGFFRTGDEGRFDESGCLYLTGRKSDLIKTSTGRRIPPTPIEAELRAAALVQEAVVVGNGRKCLTAVLALDPEAVNGTPPGELLKQLSYHEGECQVVGRQRLVRIKLLKAVGGRKSFGEALLL